MSRNGPSPKSLAPQRERPGPAADMFLLVTLLRQILPKLSDTRIEQAHRTSKKTDYEEARGLTEEQREISN
jgi:hypothetical protein